MKSNKLRFLEFAGLTFLAMLALPLLAADLTPNMENPPQKTPPEVTGSEDVGGLKVPPAVPLDKLTDMKAAPAVGAKKAADTVKPKKPAAKIPAKIEPKKEAPQEVAEKPTEKPAEKPAVKPPEKPVEVSVPAESEEVKKIKEELERIPEDLPAGKAETIVSQPMLPADQKIVKAAEKKREEEGVYFNVAGEDIREIIKQISRVAGKNFIIDDKIRGEVTIISEQKMTKDEVYEAFLSALDVAGYTTVPGPAGLTKVVKKREALTKPIPIYTEKTPYTDKFITRLITLKNIDANNMANAIKGLVSKEGNLFAYPATNTLIITDTGSNIDRIVRMVQELDTEGPQEVLEIIHIEYADVDDMADKISKLFGDEAQPTRRIPVRRGRAATTPEALPTVSKIIPDQRTNSLIILASKITIAKVKEIIRRLDRPLIGPEEGEIHVLYLKNAKATEIAEVLTGVTQAAKTAAKEEAKAAKARVRRPAVPQEEFEGLFGSIRSIKADDNTNALIIQANAKDFRLLVDRIIAKLDIPRRQVYIEATIMEIAIRKGLEFGTGALGGVTFDVGGTELALFGNTFPFIPDVTQNSSVGGATTENPIQITPPFSDNPINFPKFFAAFIAQSDEAELNILSTPNILTLDNTEARIKVGDTIPFLTGSALTTGGVQTSNIQREDVALELVVKAQITEGDNVRLNIKQKIEDFSEAQNPLEATAGPATSIREIESEVVVPDQRTVVLGGLMQDRESSRKTKIPLLGDIPILGHLFKGTSHAKRKVNLLVFLTPNIVREPQDFLLMLKKKIEQRNRFIDEHFGERGRKKIRESIVRHNEELLDFQTAVSPFSQPEFLPTDPLLGAPGVDFGAEEPMPPVPVEEPLTIKGDLSAVPPPPEYTKEEPTQAKKSWRQLSRRKPRRPRREAELLPAEPLPTGVQPRIATEPPVTSPNDIGSTPPSLKEKAKAPSAKKTEEPGEFPSEIDLAF